MEFTTALFFDWLIARTPSLPGEKGVDGIRINQMKANGKDEGGAGVLGVTCNRWL